MNAILIAQEASLFFRWGRPETLGDWACVFLIAVAASVWCVHRYRRDAAGFSRLARGTLIALRLLAIAAVTLFFLQPRWEQLTPSSRIAVVIDSSESMAIRDVLSSARFDVAHDAILHSPLLKTLTQQHNVTLYRFDSDVEVVDTVDIKPRGHETRLVDAVLSIISNNTPAPLGHIILLTDGASNAGRPLKDAIAAAQQARVAVHTLGFGAISPPRTLRITSVAVPERAASNDPFVVEVHIETTGDLADVAPINVELWQSNDNGSTDRVDVATFDPQSASRATLSLRTRGAAVGIATLEIRIVPPETWTPHSDDVLSVTRQCAITDLRTTLLIFAGGPTRDYQFLVEQLARDPSIDADLVAPWSSSGTLQSVRNIRDTFPTTSAEMASYDAVIAFDPPWETLSEEAFTVFEEWLLRHAGGTVIVAGPLHTRALYESSLRFPLRDKVRAIYPLEWSATLGMSSDGYRSGDTPQPLQFTRDGAAAEFLRLDDDAVKSLARWNEFGGFYGVTTTRAVKPAATLYATTSQQPEMQGVVFAEQWYGSGRVLLVGSGELWRLRRLAPAIFERLTTQIIRHVAQGRAMRDSDRATLATDKQRYSIGDVASIHATLNDRRLEPLILPNVTLHITTPNATTNTLTLSQHIALHTATPGSYQGYLPLTSEGEWTLRLALPDGDEVLTRRVTVTMNQRERETLVQDAAALTQLATSTGGNYLDGSNFFTDFDAVARWASQLRPASYRTVTDDATTEHTLSWLLLLVLLALVTEWFLRRCWHLA